MQEPMTPTESFRQEVAQLRQRIDKQTFELEILQGEVESLHQIASLALQRWAPDLEEQLKYGNMVRQCRGTVQKTLPADAVVIVVSRGDDELLRLSTRRGWHFPQDENGVYAGYYPATSAAAIAHLEALRVKGGDYLVFPATATWWLEHYATFRGHLERTYRLVHRSDDNCVIFALREPSPWLEVAELIADFKDRHRCCPAILNWESGVDLAQTFPECAVFAPLEPGNDQLPYVDESIDLVAVRSGEPERMEEARRVASEAVLILTPAGSNQSDLTLTIEKAPERLGQWAARTFLAASRRGGQIASLDKNSYFRRARRRAQSHGQPARANLLALHAAAGAGQLLSAAFAFRGIPAGSKLVRDVHRQQPRGRRAVRVDPRTARHLRTRRD